MWLFGLGKPRDIQESFEEYSQAKYEKTVTDFVYGGMATYVIIYLAS